MIVLHPAYTFEIVVHDKPTQQTTFTATANGVTPFNSHRFANEMAGKTGCDEALDAVKKALDSAGISAEIRLTKFDHKA